MYDKEDIIKTILLGIITITGYVLKFMILIKLLKLLSALEALF